MSEEEPKMQKRKIWKPVEEPTAVQAETLETYKKKLQGYVSLAPIFDANASAKDITAFTGKYEDFIALLRRATE